MAYRYGNRNQIRLLPESMEDYIASDDPVRAYDAFIEALDYDYHNKHIYKFHYL